MLSRLTKVATGLVGCALVATPWSAAPAQSLAEAMAYSALVTSPVGGLPSAPILGGTADAQSGWALRVGHVGTGSGGSNVALGHGMALGDGTFTLSAGATVCDGCGHYLLGAEWLIPLNDGSLRAGLRPSIGAARGIEHNSGTLYAGALSLPISWVPAAQSSGARLVPFLEPGIGYGGITGTGLSQSATRFMTTGGVAVTAGDSPFSLLLTARKVFIERGETVWGFGMNFGGSR